MVELVAFKRDLRRGATNIDREDHSRSLSGRSRRNALADNVLHVLREAGASLTWTRIVDPGNSSNIISEDLTDAEKQQVARLAADSARKGTWEKIIW